MIQKTLPFYKKILQISLTNQILIGAALGVLTGLLLGDDCKIFLPLGNAFTMLLEVVVYPFIICTLISSIGRLSPRITLHLVKHGWIIYFVLILLTFGTLIVLARAFPSVTSALQLASPSTAPPPSLMQLLIPQNLFLALTNNYVPAVVLFCILFGIMLQRVKGSAGLFKVFDTISKACIKYWHWIIKIAPLGVFTIVAYAAGTVRLEQLKSMTEYLILFSVGVALLTFWLLPAIISSLTDLRYRTIMSLLKNTLIIAASTQLSILALPYIRDITNKLLRAENVHPRDSTDIIDTVLIISYPLGQLGNFFVYMFILFASTYYNQPLSSLQHSLLPLATYLSSIGSSHTADNAVAFLTSWLHLPDDTNNLYDTLSLVTEFAQVLVTVMGFAFLSILVSLSCCGKIKLHIHKAVTHIIIVFLLLVAFAWAFSGFIPNPGIKTYQRIINATLLPDLTAGIKTVMVEPGEARTPTPAKNKIDSLFRIQRSNTLRIGYNADTTPFVYFNGKHQLVGYDVAMMYALAQTLKCRTIEFIPYEWASLSDDLAADKFDIAIGGLYVTSSRLQQAAFTEPYLKLPIALVIPQGREAEFSTAERVRNATDLKLAVSNDPTLIDLVKQFLPNAGIIPIDNLYLQMLDAFTQLGADASLWDQAGGEIWALGHPGYIAVVTPGIGPPFLMAYMVQQSSPQLLSYLNYWLELKENDGFKARAFNKWILGREVELTQSRWSILRNVFHLRWDE